MWLLINVLYFFCYYGHERSDPPRNPVIISVNWEGNVTRICDKRFSHRNCDECYPEVSEPWRVTTWFALYNTLCWFSLLFASLLTHNSAQQRGHPVLSRWFISRHLIISSLPPFIFCPHDSLHPLTVHCPCLHFPLGLSYSHNIISFHLLFTIL